MLASNELQPIRVETDDQEVAVATAEPTVAEMDDESLIVVSRYGPYDGLES